ncbi:ABC transporter ATP-binding protein [Variovorax sp. 553]|jgi:simple sugar transport system ATP-binding protein|uniref:ABC transporter ATP-binding protein n=1 Tax=Variovorax sp. 3P27G3 TaxID=2502214 RepID=UPI000F7E41FB|nr:ABC transporter ATP-binding protein [Variovorax sp. 3P27G3]RSZ30432.1 ABC transporter ATP-binding protein [Variovorax sp. 553]RSZ30969.1 ABC transporter ATP-binding protein [Variovorax sp. 679]
MEVTEPSLPPTEGGNAATVLRLQGITKRFGSLVANDDISLDLRAGEVLALLGENGAGKSTLMSILFGHYVADEGGIEAFGAPLPPGNPKAALAAGVGMVHQHFTLADNLSVLDNVLMGTEPLWRPVSRRSAARERLLDVARRFGLPVQPDALVGSLSVGERQRVEILKALYRGARILILDEPTAVLTPQESEALFATLAQMVAQGLSVIFISHKLDEVLRVSHRIAVLRGGKLVAEARTADTTQAQLALWMVGHAVEAPQRRPARSVGDAICVLDHVSTAASKGGGQDRLREVSLTLRAGEITAIAGVSGNGQVALAELLCGTRRATSGTAQLMGRPLPPSPARLVQRGVARIPEDRHAVGVVGDLPVWENAVSERLRSPVFSRWSWIVKRAAARLHARRIEKAFDVRGAGLMAPARSLSGGNMQKLILGRALLAPEQPEPAKGNDHDKKYPNRAPRLIVAHQPTWGLDIGAVAYVQQQLIAARDAGAAVLVISDDLDEVLALGDRVAVMHGGHLGEARPATAWTREAIGLAMAGATTAPRAKGASS